jgi:hypothetical protein
MIDPNFSVLFGDDSNDVSQSSPTSSSSSTNNGGFQFSNPLTSSGAISTNFLIYISVGGGILLVIIGAISSAIWIKYRKRRMSRFLKQQTSPSSNESPSSPVSRTNPTLNLKKV